jgi:hypothetical protein
LTDSKALSGFTSQSAIPEAPCSRSALAASRARVPAPPVTLEVRVSVVHEDDNQDRKGEVCTL